MKNPVRLLAVLVLLFVPVGAFAQNYVANMTGLQEVPGPGDPNGTGTAFVQIIGTTINYQITVQNITLPPIGQHIHPGLPGTFGPVFVGLPGTWVGNTLNGSTTATAAQVAAINANPGAFYVNVHTSDFMGGAVRGQLVVAAAEGAIPTTSEWGLLLLALAIAAVGLWTVRRV